MPPTTDEVVDALHSEPSPVVPLAAFMAPRTRP
jgi:hypothetical protein